MDANVVSDYRKKFAASFNGARLTPL